MHIYKILLTEYERKKSIKPVNFIATNSSGSNRNKGIIEDANILLETHNVFPSRGHIPLSNFSINSSSKVTAGIVQAAEILVRNTGEIALEDATDTTNTNTDYLLEETSGDNLDLEGATGITY